MGLPVVVAAQNEKIGGKTVNVVREASLPQSEGVEKDVSVCLKGQVWRNRDSKARFVSKSLGVEKNPRSGHTGFFTTQ
jgi:hypothetical protein